MPLDSLLTTTVAFGITAPEASCTIPEILPWPAPDCANAHVEEINVNRMSNAGAILIEPRARFQLSLPAPELQHAREDTTLLLWFLSIRPPKAFLALYRKASLIIMSD